MVSPLWNDGWIPLKPHWNHCTMTPSTNKLGGLWWSRKLQGRLKVSATQQTCGSRQRRPTESTSKWRCWRCIKVYIHYNHWWGCRMMYNTYIYMLDIHWRSIYDDSWIQLDNWDVYRFYLVCLLVWGKPNKNMRKKLYDRGFKQPDMGGHEAARCHLQPSPIW